jgi:hypothetical protein
MHAGRTVEGINMGVDLIVAAIDRADAGAK